MKRIVILIVILFVSACAKPAFKDEFENEKTWVEQLTQLPAYPEEKNLMNFDAGAATNNRYMIDPNSIKIGQDGVIRFSLVIKSSEGAQNVSYEGIRCATNERKLYALGRNDRTWAKPRVSEWEKLGLIRQFYAQRELSKNFFCPQQQIVTTSEEAIQALKAGRHPRVIR